MNKNYRKEQSNKYQISINLVLILIVAITIYFVYQAYASYNENKQNNSFDVLLEDIPEFQDKSYVVLNNNIPNFNEDDIILDSFEQYGELDELGRCSIAFANIGTDLMPTEKRGYIGQVKPSGWQTAKYNHIDGKYLYNRCHLIGYQLTAENANERNLITGTRYMNVAGMLPFENMVADYIKETNHHVLYRVTPIFKGNNLVANGVQMEAYSVEDKGEGICFNVYVYNVQPGVTINYETGENHLSKDKLIENDKSIKTEIRGNSRSQIYHSPGQAAYETMATSKHLVIFYSEQEAENAGYKKAKR